MCLVLCHSRARIASIALTACDDANSNLAHPQCARDKQSLGSDEDHHKWRCPDCVGNALEADNSEEAVRRRRSSTSKLTRDLLPASRGNAKPNSHSVFNTLILDDDPLDGSRSLRKRKASFDEVEERSRTSNKRIKRQISPIAEGSGRRSVSSHVISEATSSKQQYEAEEHKLEALTLNIKNRQQKEQQQQKEKAPQRSRPSRSRRPKKDKGKEKEREIPKLVRIVSRGPRSLVLSLPALPAGISASTRKKEKRRRPPPVTPEPAPPPAPVVRSIPTQTPAQYGTPFYGFHEKENDELKSKPYGGILSEADADTEKTLPRAPDRKRFDEARQAAEEEWKIKTAAAELESENKGRTSQKVSGPPSKIKCINFGGYEIETWYAAPYPEEYSRNRILYICEFCLKYMNSDYVAWRHKLKCPAKHPPGDEIYRHKSVSIFEVDGRKNPVYCQNLCLLAKLFLGSKTLYYDVEPFLFYIMTETDEFGCHFVGYFSKEKRPSSLNNVSCILTLPIHQRKGYGNLLIDFSYLLTRVERKTGSPEKPLSDMGLVSYRNYWRLVLSYLLIEQREPIGITDISEKTGMTADDIVAALEGLRALVRDPITKSYALRLDYNYFRQCIETWEAKDYVKLDPDALVWTPYIMGRSNLAHYDRAPPLATVAPREGEEDGDAAANQTASVAVETQPDGTVLTLQKTADSSNPSEAGTILQPIVPGPPPLAQTSLTNGLHSQNEPPRPPSTPTPEVEKIPATRYEVFPPVVGATSRRRGGWRGGPKKATSGLQNESKPGSSNTTPVRSSKLSQVKGSLALGKELSKTKDLGKGKLAKELAGEGGRRTRSMVDGADEDEAGSKSTREAERGDTASERVRKEDLEAQDSDADNDIVMGDMQFEQATGTAVEV